MNACDSACWHFALCQESVSGNLIARLAIGARKNLASLTSTLKHAGERLTSTITDAASLGPSETIDVN